jgi:uncharacterized protein YegL
MQQLLAMFLMLGFATTALADTKLLVTVTDKKSGEAITGLQAADFTVTVGNAGRRVTECAYTKGPIDIVLMLDSSLIGQQVSRLAPGLIGQLDENEQMSIVAYDSSAELIQGFTSSQDLLRQAVNSIQFGNSPRLTDALYAVTADGFEDSTYRRVILLLTTGVDGPSSVTEEDLLKTCRRNEVSIFPIHMMKYGRSKLARLARLTGGATFSAQEISKNSEDPGSSIFDSMRGHYQITVSGNLSLGNKARFDIRGQNSKRLLVAYLELE